MAATTHQNLLQRSRLPTTLLPLLLLAVLPAPSSGACPSSCRCTPASTPDTPARYEVRCSGRTLEGVPGGLPGEATDLWLTGTGMKTLPAGKLSGLPALRRLYVTENLKLDAIAIGAFSGLGALEELHLTGNAFRFVQVGTFVGLTHLRVLDLSRNQWTVAIATMFSGMTQLRAMDLSNNNLTDLGEGPFSATLPALEEFNLANNKLKGVNSKVFSGGWGSVREVDLSGNLLEKVPIDGLVKLSGLRSLDVSGNPLRSLQGNAFQTLSTLETLKLNAMEELRAVSTAAFGRLYNLKRFEFRDNKRIKDFPADLLPEHNQALERVDLSNNLFTTLEGALLFMNRPNLTELLLDNLPLHCDCRLSWLGAAQSNSSRWPWAAGWGSEVNNNGANSTTARPPVCVTPVNLEQRSVGEMVEEDFTCEGAGFYNVSTLNETTVNLTDTVTLTASLSPGLPSSLWVHPSGWTLRGSREENSTMNATFTATETINSDDRRVVATLTIASVSPADLGVYTLVATNAAGNRTQHFRVRLEDDSVLSTPRPANLSACLQGTEVLVLAAVILCTCRSILDMH